MTTTHKRSKKIIWLRRFLPMAALLIVGVLLGLLLRPDWPMPAFNAGLQLQGDAVVMTDIVFDGKTDDGHNYHIAARQARRDGGDGAGATQTILRGLTAQLDAPQNPLFLSAQSGIFDQQKNVLILRGQAASNNDADDAEQGQAQLRQGAMRLLANHIKVTFSSAANNAKQSPTHLVARGKVQFIEPTRTATGARADYDVATRRLVMRGDVQLIQHSQTDKGAPKPQTFSGPKLIIDMRSGQAVFGDNDNDAQNNQATPRQRGRVRIQLNP